MVPGNETVFTLSFLKVLLMTYISGFHTGFVGGGGENDARGAMPPWGCEYAPSNVTRS